MFVHPRNHPTLARTMHRFHLILALVLAAAARQPVPSARAEVPSPESHLGYRPGADFHLAHWQTVVDYFRKVDDTSDRVSVRELGKTTEGRPFVVAIVSSPDTIDDLPRFQDLQRRLADPRLEDGKVDDNPVGTSKAVVLITCSIHSTETASTLMAMELLHGLATGDDPGTREILDRTILLLVPSVNPDGVETVADWYERSLGHPWEGGGMPTLYHTYAGHDTNRDWFMLNLQETRLLTRLLYKEWFPTLTYDVHQMGGRGARLFVPPFYDPINPNLDPRLHQGIALIGSHMAADLAAAGKPGVLTNAMYDNWWNGGNRTTPQRHNMVGVLTEAASVRMASPIFLEAGELRGGSRGFRDHEPAANFVDPWPGGWWRLRDIVDYELICARSLLTLAARYKASFQENYRAMARKAIATGEDEPPFAWVVPGDQDDPGTAAKMVRILHETGIEVHRARSPFRAAQVEYPAGSWIMPAAQPYRAHLKDMMERQVYPDRFTAGGAAEPPYDVAGWTLPLQMGVRALAVADRFEIEAEPVREVERPQGGIEGVTQPEMYLIRNRSNDDFKVLHALLEAGVEVEALTTDRPIGGEVRPAGTLCIRAEEESRRVLERVLPAVSTRVVGVAEGLDSPEAELTTLVFHPQRIGLYQPWVPSMDEGWTRLVLENAGLPYTTLHNAEIRAGALDDRIDVLVIPSIQSRILRDGYEDGETAPEYVGGIGPEGIDAIDDFIEAGGTLVCLEESSLFAIEAFALPVADSLEGLKSSEFYAPGSIVRIASQAGSPLTLGMPEQRSAYFDRSLAFSLREPGSAEVVVRYAEANLLESGWLLGPEKLQGKAAVVEVPRVAGRIVLFGFPPQHRGQPHGTFRLFFNALFRGGMSTKTRSGTPPVPAAGGVADDD